jgi:outer membrane protein TolC
LSASSSLQVWNDEVTAEFGLGGGSAPELPPPTDPYEQVIAGLFTASEPIVIREQVTWDVGVTLAQPIGPLYSIHENAQAAGLAQDAAAQKLTQVEREQARDAAVAYFRVLQAEASLQTAEKAVEQLLAQSERLDALVEAGSAKRADKLRIDVALASAKQKVFKARSSVELARSNLAVTVGRDPDQPVSARPIPSATLPRADGTLQDALADAEASRPELARLELELQRVDAGIRAQKGQYVPELVALGQYSHTEGQGLAANDTFFVGLSLDWTIWQWGARKHAVDETLAERVGLQATYDQTRRQLGLQVKSAWYDLRSSLEAYGVADAAVEQAEEAYRVESARYEAGKSTSTDLLDAQSAQTEARNNRISALYQALIHHTELIFATGEPLTASRLLERGER